MLKSPEHAKINEVNVKFTCMPQTLYQEIVVRSRQQNLSGLAILLIASAHNFAKLLSGWLLQTPASQRQYKNHQPKPKDYQRPMTQKKENPHQAKENFYKAKSRCEAWFRKNTRWINEK